MKVEVLASMRSPGILVAEPRSICAGDNILSIMIEFRRPSITIGRSLHHVCSDVVECALRAFFIERWNLSI